LISAIVLAAGKSERMGRPKALLDLGGKTFLDNILDSISVSPIAEVFVVVGHHREVIEERLTRAAIIYNPDYEQGMVTSFQAGIRALSPTSEGAMLFLVDHPVVEPALIRLLIEQGARDRIVVPEFKGRRGHPVLFGRESLDEILELLPSQGANAVLRRRPDRVIQVAVDFPGILIDVDTPEDYQKLL
jgi:molybdenum cofactor cytidylyltransferase